MRFTHIDVNFDVRYEGHQNCPKILSMNILRVFSDHHMWRQNWHQYVWTSLCQFKFFVNLLHSLGVWFFDIWHFFDNLTSFWQLDIFLILDIFLEANCPWAPLLMCLIPLYPIAHVSHCSRGPYPLYPIPMPLLPMSPIPLYPIPLVGLIAHMPHTLSMPLPMWPIARVAHTPCTPLPIGPIPLYPIAHTPCTPIPPLCPHGPYPLYTSAPLPITPAPHWVIGQWGTGSMGHIGNGSHGQWGLQGVWDTGGMGHMGNWVHGQ